MPRKDPEQRKAYQRAYIKRTAEKHREHSREAMRRWRANNPEARLARDRAYKQRHLEQVRAGHRRYRLRYPDVRRIIWQRRRARELGAGGNFTIDEWAALCERYGQRCAYCGSAGPLQVDHRVPLARGGTHDMTNILPACQSCNLKKGASSEQEFRARLRSRPRSDPKIDREAG